LRTGGAVRANCARYSVHQCGTIVGFGEWRR
jgi:hypothetical protein